VTTDKPTVHSPAVMPTGCCPRFDPAPWQDQELHWEGKLFVRDRLRTAVHVPVDMRSHIAHELALINAAHALPDPFFMLYEDVSAWGADIRIAVTGPVPGAQMDSLSGTFLTRVYDGPYSQTASHIEAMKRSVAAAGRRFDRVFFFYPTCPTCSRAYGENPTVVLARLLLGAGLALSR